MLTLKDFTVRVGKKQILHRINFQFVSGKIYAIMGPNGSGKSTLAMSVMGYPEYQVDKNSQLLFEGESIVGLSSEKRAQKGIFLSFQTPVPLSGVNIYQLLRFALEGRIDPLKLQRKLARLANQLKINRELLNRSLNQDFSGGEKKKMEILQAAVLEPRLIFFDEIDTGVDVDTMETMANFLRKHFTRDKTVILITHYNRILRFIKPDRVLVIKGGRLIAEGGSGLADRIDRQGYESLVKNRF